MNEYGDISRQLKAGRLQAGLSLSQVARKSDTSVATISRYENGWTRFELCTLRKLAAALGCTLTVTLTAGVKRGSRPSHPEKAAIRRLNRLFWDRRIRPDDLETYPGWIVVRVLEYGALDDVRILMSLMGRDRFLDTVSRVKFQSPKTRSFWSRMLDKEGISCTTKRCPNTAARF